MVAHLVGWVTLFGRQFVEADGVVGTWMLLRDPNEAVIFAAYTFFSPQRCLVIRDQCADGRSCLAFAMVEVVPCDIICITDLNTMSCTSLDRFIYGYPVICEFFLRKG